MAMNTMSIIRMNTILPSLRSVIQRLTNEFNQISAQRRTILKELSDFVSYQKKNDRGINLNFICTHNSRRSHIAQVWAQLAAQCYGIKNVHCYSGGTEATAFNPRAVRALQDAGFDIQVFKDGTNPTYQVRFSDEAPALTVFSKRYDDDFNTKVDFAAIMTCTHADGNCPLILGATKRISLTYGDPKDFDGTPLETAAYSERVHEIGREILFAFSQV